MCRYVRPIHTSAIYTNLTDPPYLGMYSRSAWGGPVDPFVLTVFPNKTYEGDADPIVSLIVFEWKDQDLIGVYPSPDALQVRSIHDTS